MAKHKCKKCPECPAGEKWAVPTADFFSLLLALFIALFAIASVNKEKIKAVKEEFVKIYDYAPAPQEITPVVDMVSENNPTPDATANAAGSAPVTDGGSLLVGAPPTKSTEAASEAIQKIQQDLKNASMGSGPLDQSMDGVLLKLPTSIPFKGANATIDNEELHLFLRRVTDIINTLPPTVDISIRGYTDNQPLPPGAGYKDNIELSSRRAETVMRELIRNGVAPERLSTAGFGAAKPVAENTTEENRAKNRRVEFYMYVSNDTPLDQAKQNNILDALSKLQK
ncbi:OmpA/MotB domain protein [Sulfuricurvum kujiense DSM 16994]|uniref:OmpA/MotB domain protein n=1 Tax=Sulfuricurvum kujiense (strain ATCC BAA-921 / DSM 16994 / JCM 11577 / YK-1) TaxID=709032 RepID=E4U0P8_SULKY|nr:flagellar motor protein MotB [Sulfuricurvum kujiense]ADR33274.1 OmpA/MotB domain protein [Sulfuricurvum kujiense DSM 16994]